MDKMLRSLKSYVDEGGYYADAKKWYLAKYVHPLCHRSVLCFIVAIILILVFSLYINIQSLLPLSKQLKYSISVVRGDVEKSAQVMKANQVPNKPLESIAYILLSDFVKTYEEYNYNDLAQKHAYIKRCSTRMVLKDYEAAMRVDNVNSPLLRYQKEAERRISIKSVNIKDDRHGEVIFESIGVDVANQVFEIMEWKAVVEFEVDNIDVYAPANTPFYFIVSDYNTTLIQNKSPENYND
jgi:type IV secretion system protein VirB8